MKKSEWAFLIIALCVAMLLLGIGINKPFFGQHDWNGVRYGSIARDYLRDGIFYSKMGLSLHYPPLFPLLLTSSRWIMGPSEGALRSVSIIFSLLTLLSIYILGRKLYHKSVAIIATLFTVPLPMFLYFGKMPVHEVILLPLILITVYRYICWLELSTTKQMIYLLVFLILSELVTWPVYILPLLFLFHYIYFYQRKFSQKPANWQIILPLIASISIIILHFFHIKLATGSFFGGGFIGIFLSRLTSNDKSAAIFDFSFLNILRIEIIYFRIYFTNTLLCLSAVWLVKKIVQFFRQKEFSFADSMLAILAVQGIWYVLVFREVGYYHEYLLFYAIPFVVFSASVSVIHVLKNIKIPALKMGIFIALVLLVAVERREFLWALQKSNNSEKGYRLGVFLNDITSRNDRILIGSDFYKEFFELFIIYYSDRNPGYNEHAKIVDIPKYDWVIRPKAHDALSMEVKTYLDNSFSRYENGEFVWYDLKSKKI